MERGGGRTRGAMRRRGGGIHHSLVERETDLKQLKEEKKREKEMEDKKSKRSGGKEVGEVVCSPSFFDQPGGREIRRWRSLLSGPGDGGEQATPEEREEEVYMLTKRTGELAEDRDRIRLALEQTEAALIGYRERSHSNEERVALLQRTVAELEVDQRRLTTRSSHLKHQNQQLRSHRKELRHRLRTIRETDGEERRLKSRIRELEEQSGEGQSVSCAPLRDNQSLPLVCGKTFSQSWPWSPGNPCRLFCRTETQRLDRSFREEEFRMSLSQ
ncbi:hypothetical protein N1851_018381 [Merluccius polli]|uniref:Uncharacterized protein n=1 Tax=Merluccius polli TaxID=89951 RepID=A0AA47MNZ6_MERPO|nr:hypothetical protein N1851_018381 [Merluccius polli]